MAVVWNYRERKTQIVGNFYSEIEVSRGMCATLHLCTAVVLNNSDAGMLMTWRPGLTAGLKHYVLRLADMQEASQG